ncbi:hypothetical protein TrCOL_g6704 [Triparma columacea]|uniref:Uncharacterized protein n=1 Tax=Triparma columacea TaxID=722753 RepID=A0A9W7L1N1_9STRA|nr:hypothetical protein TrCOL_g6704 [Triparma columacea]
MAKGVDISARSSEDPVNEHMMSKVPGLVGDYADVLLCGASFAEDAFLETDFVRIPKRRTGHQKEEQLEELEMKERSSSDDHFSQVNPQANSANIKKNPV